MCKWRLTVENSKGEEPEDYTETFWDKKNAIKQAIDLITDDNGLFDTRDDLEKVKKELEETGCYVDRIHGVTYTIDVNYDEGDDFDDYAWDYWVKGMDGNKEDDTKPRLREHDEEDEDD